MNQREESIRNEIQLKDDECCIVFDFGCYFPYINYEILKFDFSLGMESFDDYKINHRYPNKFYQTISKKYGRKVSRLGYPYIMKLDEQNPMILSVEIGMKDNYITLLFPINTNMTKEKPICGLTLHFNFKSYEFCFISHDYMEKDGSWTRHEWYSHENDNHCRSENKVLLSTPYKVEDSNMLIYEDVIEPCASAINHLLIR